MNAVLMPRQAVDGEAEVVGQPQERIEERFVFDDKYPAGQGFAVG